MGSRGDLQTPYADAVMPTPSGAADGGGTSGGFDLTDGKKESPNAVSGLPALPTTVSPGEGAPGPDASLPWPPAESPGTIPSQGVGTD